MAAPITADLLDMFPDTVTVTPYSTETRHGLETFDTANAFDCPARVIGRTRRTTDSDGQERVSHAQAVLCGDFDVNPKDLFTLPERFTLKRGDTNIIYRQPTCIAVDRETDENGGHHVTLYFSPTPRTRGY